MDPTVQLVRFLTKNIVQKIFFRRTVSVNFTSGWLRPHFRTYLYVPFGCR